MKVLALGAHPDDLEILVFGTLLAWKAQGAALALAFADIRALLPPAPPVRPVTLRSEGRG